MSVDSSICKLGARLPKPGTWNPINFVHKEVGWYTRGTSLKWNLNLPDARRGRNVFPHVHHGNAASQIGVELLVETVLRAVYWSLKCLPLPQHRRASSQHPRSWILTVGLLLLQPKEPQTALSVPKSSVFLARTFQQYPLPVPLIYRRVEYFTRTLSFRHARWVIDADVN